MTASDFLSAYVPRVIPGAGHRRFLRVVERNVAVL